MTYDKEITALLVIDPYNDLISEGLADVTATVLIMGSAQASEKMKSFLLAITLSANFIGNQMGETFMYCRSDGLLVRFPKRQRQTRRL